MNNYPTKSATRSDGLAHQDLPTVEPHAGDEWLLGPSVFGDLDDTVSAVAPPKPSPPVVGVPLLRLAVMGLDANERELLESIIKVSQRRTPRLHLLSEVHARQADVLVIDAHNPAAVAWAHQHPWLVRRAVIWIDGSEAVQGHTLLRRPVQWAMLPMLLARAIEHGPAREIGMDTGPLQALSSTQPAS